MNKRAWLDEMTWDEAREAFKKTDIAVICCGATHGHGVAAPLGTDTFVAQGIGERVGKKSNVIVVPTIPIGYNEYHMDFPGCLNFSKKLLADIYMAICESLHKWGIKKVIFLNPHGGNTSSIEDVAYRIRYEKGMLSAQVSYGLASALDPKLAGYGSEGMVDEAAMTMYLRPDLAHPERTTFKEFKNPFGPAMPTINHRTFKYGNGQVTIYNTSKDITDTCDWGNTPKALDMSNATRELGEGIIERASEFIIAFIEEFRKVKIPPTY